jgi:hypothetical protein
MNWITDPQWPTNCWQIFWNKWHDLSLIMLHICHLCTGLWTKELAEKFVLYASTHGYTVVVEIGTVLLGGLVLFSEMVVIEICAWQNGTKGGLFVGWVYIYVCTWQCVCVCVCVCVVYPKGLIVTPFPTFPSIEAPPALYLSLKHTFIF